MKICKGNIFSQILAVREGLYAYLDASLMINTSKIKVRTQVKLRGSWNPS